MRAGFYECDVTPPIGGFVSGHGAPVFSDEVYTRLYAKAIVVEDNGELAAIVVMDTFSVPPDAFAAIAKRVYEFTGITEDKICVTANHTHSGAPVIDNAPIECFADRTFKDVFLRLCADAIILAYRNLAEVDVTFSTSEVKGACFNRNYILDDGTYVTQPRPNAVAHLDGVDEEVPVLMFERDGKPIGAIINYALHQCLTNEPVRGYSGDYAAIMSTELKKVYGKDFVSVFLLGTCGDVNHINPDKSVERVNYKGVGAALAASVVESQKSRVSVEGTVKNKKEYIDIKCRPADMQTVAPDIQKLFEKGNVAAARKMIAYASIPRPEVNTLPIQSIKIGDTLVACLPGEMFVTYGKEIKKRSPFKHTIVVEQCYRHSGYIASMKAFEPEKSNLYETTLSASSRHVPEAGTIITETALRIAEEIK